MGLKRLSLIASGGGLGAVLRYAVILLMPSSGLPWNILLVNLSGSFAIGLMMAAAVEFEVLSARSRMFWGVGFLGGYTTFSTYTLGVYQEVLDGRFVEAYGYGVGTLLGGLLATYAGIVAVRAVVAHYRRQVDTE